MHLRIERLNSLTTSHKEGTSLRFWKRSNLHNNILEVLEEKQFTRQYIVTEGGIEKVSFFKGSINLRMACRHMQIPNRTMLTQKYFSFTGMIFASDPYHRGRILSLSNFFSSYSEENIN